MATNEPDFRPIVVSDSDREFVDTMRRIGKECHDSMMSMLNIPEHILRDQQNGSIEDDD